MMNNALAYWSDNTVSLADFTGEFGFRKLLHQAVLYISYVRTRDNTMTQMLVTLSDAAKNRSFNFEKPRHYDPATNGNLHVWDLIRAADPMRETGWTTVDVADYGRIQVKAVLPLTIVPKIVKRDDRNAISSVLSMSEIMNYQMFGVYSRIHNRIIARMSSGELYQMEENQKNISWLQSLEEQLRLEKKKEIDEKLKKHWEEKDKTNTEKIEDIKLVDPNKKDLSESHTIETGINIKRQNVMDELGQNGKQDTGI